MDLGKIFELSHLDKEEKVKRIILIRIILLTSFFGIIWGVLYIFLQLYNAAFVVFTYSAISFTNLFIFYLSKKYNYFRFVQLLLIMFMPLALQYTLGGFSPASAVAIAAMLCPMGALMFHRLKVAKVFFYLFILMMILSGIAEYFLLEERESVSRGTRIFFSVMNIISVSYIAFILLEYFVAKKDFFQELLFEKNKDITDSINYAKRIQYAILPPDEKVKKAFPDSFVLFLPKDIVSGDFYWCEQWGNQALIAAVDCTGHGVPGAFLSIVGFNLLNQCLHEHGITKPSVILNSINKGFSKIIHQNNKNDSVNDGMDISLCSLNIKIKKLEYAGAYNPLWLIRNGVLTETKADKVPIGAPVENDYYQFANHEIDLLEGDTFYIFSDGFGDQFGGPKGKKFKHKQLQQLLLSIQSKSMQEQKNILLDTISNWKGDLDQVDDILVIGVRV